MARPPLAYRPVADDPGLPRQADRASDTDDTLCPPPRHRRDTYHLEKRRHGLDRIGRMLGNRSCPMSNPDADLLSLGVRLFEAEAEAVRADAAFDEIHNQILENVETVATWPADAEQWTWENTEAYVKALRQFRDAAGEPYTVASKTMNKAWARYDAIAAAIRASNPKTAEGLSIKALVPPLLDDGKPEQKEPRAIQ